MTQPITTPLDDPATIDAIIAQVGAAYAGHPISDTAGQIRKALRLANEHVAPYVQRQRIVTDAIIHNIGLDLDAAEAKADRVKVDRDIVVARLVAERDAARAELAACRPTGIRVIGDWSEVDEALRATQTDREARG